MKYFYRFLLMTFFISPCFSECAFAMEEDDLVDGSLSKKQFTHKTLEKNQNITKGYTDEILPLELRAYIFSFLDQKTLLLAGLIKQSWRNAAKICWKNQTVEFSSRYVRGRDYEILAGGVFSKADFKDVIWECKEQPNSGVKEVSLIYKPEEDSENNMDYAPTKVIQRGSNTLDPDQKIQFIQDIGKVLHLTHLELDGFLLEYIPRDAFTDILFQHSGLKKLSLINCEIDDPTAQELGLELNNFTNLESIDLSDNNIGPEGAKAIAENIPPSLNFISLRYNPIQSEGALALTSRLTPALHKLLLENTDIDVEGLQNIAAILQKKETVTELALESLDWGNMDDEALIVNDILKRNTYLTSFSINDHAFSGSSLACFGKSLEKNSTLKKFELKHADDSEYVIHHKYIKSLVDSLRINSTLEYLDLEGNSISKKGQQILEDFVKEKPELVIKFGKDGGIFSESEDEE